jgi:hypothetical protein
MGACHSLSILQSVTCCLKNNHATEERGYRLWRTNQHVVDQNNIKQAHITR